MTVQDDTVAAIDAIDAKIEDVITVLDSHTAALADVRQRLEDALKAQDLAAVAAAKDRLVDHMNQLAAAADRMRAGDPAPAPVEPVAPVEAPAPEQPVVEQPAQS